MTIKKIAMKSKNRQKKTENKLKTDYVSVKLEFEKFHAKIINKSFFIFTNLAHTSAYNLQLDLHPVGLF